MDRQTREQEKRGTGFLDSQEAFYRMSKLPKQEFSKRKLLQNQDGVALVAERDLNTFLKDQQKFEDIRRNKQKKLQAEKNAIEKKVKGPKMNAMSRKILEAKERKMALGMFRRGFSTSSPACTMIS